MVASKWVWPHTHVTNYLGVPLPLPAPAAALAEPVAHHPTLGLDDLSVISLCDAIPAKRDDFFGERAGGEGRNAYTYPRPACPAGGNRRRAARTPFPWEGFVIIVQCPRW